MQIAPAGRLAQVARVMVRPPARICSAATPLSRFSVRLPYSRPSPSSDMERSAKGRYSWL
jgi:hypothetical protein